MNINGVPSVGIEAGGSPNYSPRLFPSVETKRHNNHSSVSRKSQENILCSTPCESQVTVCTLLASQEELSTQSRWGASAMMFISSLST